MRFSSLPLLLSLLALVLLSITLSATSQDTVASCAAGLPTGGLVPGEWTQQNFTLTLTEVAGGVSANASSSSNSSSSSSNSSLTLTQWLINGTFPGPRIDVGEFSWVNIRITTQLSANTLTALHWHGLLQYGTPYSDGVAGVSQCGIGNSSTITYSFCAYPAGSHWYRGVNALQTMQGLYGPLVVGPVITLVNGTSAVAANYSAYTGDQALMIADTYDVDLSTMSLPATGPIPQPQQIIVNGQLSGASFLYLNGSNVIIRLYNAGAFRPYVFSIDGVALTLTSLDGAAVQPRMNLASVRIGVGQRVTVIVDLTLLKGYNSVFYRITALGSSSPSASNTGNSSAASGSSSTFLGVIQLSAASSNGSSLPSYATTNSSVAAPITPANDTFSDVNGLFARPTNYEAMGYSFFSSQIGSASDATTSLNLNLLSMISGTSSLGLINNVTLPITQEALLTSTTVLPLLYEQVFDIDSAIVPNVTASPSAIIPPSNTSQYAVDSGAVVLVNLYNSDAVEHSFHMHGHHFWITSASDNPLAEFTSNNQFIVRDTVVIPANGWARIRFIANNPGAWLLSSASDWYASTGMALVVLESTYALDPNFVNLPNDQLSLCNASIQAELSAALLEWHSVNDPVTYASSGLSQASRIVIGSVVGGVAGGIVLTVILCTIFGIKRDDPNEIKAHRRNPQASAPLQGGPASVTEDPTDPNTLELTDAPSLHGHV